jgi:hypothetical protein
MENYLTINRHLKHFLILYLIIILLAGGLGWCLFKDKEVKLITIEVPERTGAFPPLEITPVTKAKDSIVYRDRVVYLKDSTEVNKELAEKYLQAIHERDSLKQLNLYLSAIQIRRYNETFEDEYIKLSFEAETTGYLNYITPSYIIKPYSLTVPIKERKKLAFYFGASVRNNLVFDNFAVGGILGYKNKKDNVFLVEYNTKEEITVTHLINIFNF